METINDRIGILIEKLDITKTAVADKLNVTQPYISKLIKKGTPSERLVEDICEKFNVNKNWLLDGKGEIFSSENAAIKQVAIMLGKKDPDFEAIVQIYYKLSDENKKLFVKLGRTLLENEYSRKG